MTERAEQQILKNDSGSVLALSPLLLFITLFLGTGLYLHWQGVAYAFYQLPAPVAIIPAVILALLLDKRLNVSSGTDLSLETKGVEASLHTFISGMGNNKVVTMCLIYLLAGAFSSVAKASGGVEAVVSLGIELIPAPFVIAGLFVISAIIATAMGTSMGTIGAVAPIAMGVTEVAGLEPALVAGAVVGGAMFGDNLSFISDTTIASTKTQGAELKDKFRENLKFALPAALFCILMYSIIGFGNNGEIAPQSDANWLLAVPYFLIIILAVAGVNVFAVLLLGVLLSGITGSLVGSYEISALGKDVYAGFTGMQEIFLLSMLIGGLSELMKQQGGLTFLVNKIEKLVSRSKGSSAKGANQMAIAGLAFTTNLAIANNTVAIIVTGDTAKQLANDADISAKRSASLLDIFSCIAQGLVPYGAQALLAAASFAISPIEVIAQVWYCYVLAAISILTIFLRRKSS